jgi:hypothetical protein
MGSQSASGGTSTTAVKGTFLRLKRALSLWFAIVALQVLVYGPLVPPGKRRPRPDSKAA